MAIAHKLSELTLCSDDTKCPSEDDELDIPSSLDQETIDSDLYLQDPSWCGRWADESTAASDFTEELDTHSSLDQDTAGAALYKQSPARRARWADESTMASDCEEFDAPFSPAPEEAAGPGRCLQGRTPHPQWHLVWCHERVLKSDNDQARIAMSQAARRAGATLICPKKSDKFAQWLSQRRRLPYVLLTSWREVKPCLEAASIHPLKQPSLTVVVAEQLSIFKRASTWAAALSPSCGLVHVCQDIGHLEDFMDFVQGHISAGSSPTMEETRQNFHAQAVAEHAGAAVASSVGREDVRDFAGTHSQMQSSRELQAVLSAVLPVSKEVMSFSPAQIERILRQAMPEQYDD